MNKSPTLNNINNNFLKIKKKFNIQNKNHINPFIIFIYEIITLFILIMFIYFKSKIVYSKSKHMDDLDDMKLCYYKVILFYILLHIPVLFYFIFSRFLR